MDAALSLRSFADLQDLARIGTAWGGATVEPSRSFSRLNRADALPAHRPMSESRGGIHVQWFSRNYGWGDYVAEQDRFADLFVSLGAPHGMMMFCAGRPAKTVIYIAVDAKLAAAHFPGFRPADTPPRAADFLVGHDEDGAEFRWGGRQLTYPFMVTPAMSRPAPEAVRESLPETTPDRTGRTSGGSRNSLSSAAIRTRGGRAGAGTRRAGAVRRWRSSGQQTEHPEHRGRNMTERSVGLVARPLRGKFYMGHILRPLKRAFGTFSVGP
jgi:hypothetical protein